MAQNDTKRSENDDRDWSSLPEEIWSMIRSHLIGRPLDILRFRSVCSFFRSLFPFSLSSSSSSSSSSFPFSLPDLPRFSFTVPTFSSSFHAFVSRTTLFRLDRPFHHDGAGWIVKIQYPFPHHDHNRKFCLLDPLSCHRINDLIASKGGAASGFLLNDFRLTELTSAYALR